MTGSILPSRAAWVRSLPYFSNAWNVPSGSAVVTRAEPRTDCSASASAAALAPCWRSTSATSPSVAARASTRCSAETKSSDRSRASRSAAPRTASVAREADGAETEDPEAEGNLSTSRDRSARTPSGSAPTAWSSGRASVSASSSSATARCAGSTAGLPRSAAALTALFTACVLRVVMSMRVVHLIGSGVSSECPGALAASTVPNDRGLESVPLNFGKSAAGDVSMRTGDGRRLGRRTRLRPGPATRTLRSSRAPLRFARRLRALSASPAVARRRGGPAADAPAAGAARPAPRRPPVPAGAARRRGLSARQFEVDAEHRVPAVDVAGRGGGAAVDLDRAQRGARGWRSS